MRYNGFAPYPCTHANINAPWKQKAMVPKKVPSEIPLGKLVRLRRQRLRGTNGKRLTLQSPASESGITARTLVNIEQGRTDDRPTHSVPLVLAALDRLENQRPGQESLPPLWAHVVGDWVPMDEIRIRERGQLREVTVLLRPQGMTDTAARSMMWASD